MTDLRATTTVVSTRIDWVCSACGSPAGAGVLHIDLRDVRDAETAAKAWEAHKRSREAFDVADVFAMPTLAQWQVSCLDCLNEHDCGGCYQVDLDRCATLTALLRWQAHLYGKSWFGVTNWVAFVHGVAQQHAPAESAGVW